MFRGFATKAKAVIARQFHWKQFKILWRDRIHRTEAGEEAIKEALRQNEAEYLREGMTDWQFRGEEHGNPEGDKKMHWTLYVLVKGVITKAAHLYRGGSVIMWDVAAEEAAKVALAANRYIEVVNEPDNKVGEGSTEVGKTGSQ